MDKSGFAEQFAGLFSGFECAVIRAYLSRVLPESPDYHPAKAYRILQRWPEVIDNAMEVVAL